MQAEGSSSRAYDPEEPRQAQTQTVTLLQSHRYRKRQRDRASVFALQTYGLRSGDVLALKTLLTPFGEEQKPVPLHLSYNSSA